ncbi:hypothetical protein AAMO2058_000323600 [Amorphochlora amoebiformis]
MRLYIVASIIVGLSAAVTKDESDSRKECDWPDGVETCATGGTGCKFNCMTQCNKTTSLTVSVGRKKGVLKVDMEIEDKHTAFVPCRKINNDYRGNISLQCFKGTLVADASSCAGVCVLGPWKQSGACSVTCGIGRVEHRREVLQRPGRGQEACGGLSKFVPCWMPKCPVDCEVGPWEDAGACTATCGNGVKLQKRQIITKAMYGGLSCPETHRNVPCCIDGTGDGCAAKKCRFGQWQDIGPCNVTCGPGHKEQMRTVEMVGGGDTSSCGPVHRVVECNGDCPRVDCEEGEWENVGECSVTCGIGQQLQRRSIQRHPKNGGRVCGSLRRHVECEMRECPIVQCASVHANTECVGRPFSKGLSDLGRPGDTGNCRLMGSEPSESKTLSKSTTEKDGEPEDIALMIRNCSQRCDEMKGCHAYNWYAFERKCCFLSSRMDLQYHKRASCYELISVQDDDMPAGCKDTFSFDRSGYRSSSSSSSSSRSSDSYSYRRQRGGRREEKGGNSFAWSITIALFAFIIFFCVCDGPYGSYHRDVDDFLGASLFGRGRHLSSPTESFYVEDTTQLGPRSPDRSQQAVPDADLGNQTMGPGSYSYEY